MIGAGRLQAILECGIEAGPVADQDGGGNRARSRVEGADAAADDVANVGAEIRGPLIDP